jgi:hypothetical protein
LSTICSQLLLDGLKIILCEEASGAAQISGICDHSYPILFQSATQARFKVMRNIGLAFVRMGQYQDALQAFAQVMEQAPEHQV